MYSKPPDGLILLRAKPHQCDIQKSTDPYSTSGIPKYMPRHGTYLLKYLGTVGRYLPRCPGKYSKGEAGQYLRYCSFQGLGRPAKVAYRDATAPVSGRNMSTPIR